MRVVYNFPGNYSSPSPAPSAGKGEREQVLVVSAEKTSDTGASGAKEGFSLSDRDYDVEISREALERNGEVRRHENAHMAALGSAADSGIIYNTMKGPGGETIAVGGKIAVDLSEIPGDPAATLSKARTIIGAAHAAASPSGGDMRTAAQAYRLASKAQEQLIQEQSRGKIDIFA